MIRDDREATRVRPLDSLERLFRQAEAKRIAQSLWASAAPAHFHNFLSRHGVPAAGLRQRGPSLIVPMRDALGVLWNLQFIAPGGRHKRVYGGRVLGLFHLFGEAGSAQALHVAEMTATAAKVHAQTGEPTAVAFALHNLRAVALSLRATYPTANITLWLPEPPSTVRGEALGFRGGWSAAKAAACAVGGSVAVLRAPT